MNDEDEFILYKLYSKSLPGIGRRTVPKIIKERELTPFESFKDFERRVNKNLLDAITKRIENEIKEPQEYYLYVDWKEKNIISKNDINVVIPPTSDVKYRWRKF
jgi:predicted nucleic acid-binding OB-fold protein